MPGQGLLLVMTDIPAGTEAEFNRWYDEEHMRDMAAFPGILSARRYRIVEGGPKYLAMYELEDPGVLERPEYQKISGWSPAAHPTSIRMSKQYFNTIRGVYQHLLTLPSPEPTDVSRARGLLLRGLNIDKAHQGEFDDWYLTEHMPNLAGVPGTVRARRYQLAPGASNLMGNPPPYMAVYEVEHPRVVSSAAWEKAAMTPWTMHMRKHFIPPSHLRNIYECIFPK